MHGKLQLNMAGILQLCILLYEHKTRKVDVNVMDLYINDVHVLL